MARKPHLGVIADDFTGATDIASFLVNNGMSTVQLNGVPADNYQVDADAIVISLKSRSCPVEEAVQDSLNALTWLQSKGCQQFYFKYCSTFDSTPKGNIGPVTDALLNALNETQTIISPALPVNGRTVYKGYLFVMDQLLSESGMRNHPVTPMTDSNLLRLMDAQSIGRSGLIDATVMDQGVNAVTEKLTQLKTDGIRYVVMDTLNEEHLLTQGKAVRNMKLVTGGSGLAIGLARQWADPAQDKEAAKLAGAPQGEKCVVLSGSCSVMTNQQVKAYKQKAPARLVEIEHCFASDEARENYVNEVCQWIEQHAGQALAPLLYATTEPETLKVVQTQWGAEKASHAIEALFAAVSRRLLAAGFNRFIVAGGETSGVVVQSLGIKAFYIGPTISPGVPWVKSVDHPISLALKSGNFGDVDFFSRAQEEFAV